jgi:DNA adenine methylase
VIDRSPRVLPPVIKWSGSKRKVAVELSSLFPDCDTFFDPFVGGGSLVPFSTGAKAVAADVIHPLIALWKLIRDEPVTVARGYADRWARLQAEGHTAYYEIRSSFNETSDPVDLLFLSRTCVNGLIRFNANGQFNNSLHHTRPGIAPSRLSEILKAWSARLTGVDFVCSDYRETLACASRGDFIFLDPPYASNRGRYKPNTFLVSDFFEELERLNSLGVRWMLTFDGTAGQRDYDDTVPEDLYLKRFSVATGHSPFPRLLNNRLDSVNESVFVNFEPTAKTRASCVDAR